MPKHIEKETDLVSKNQVSRVLFRLCSKWIWDIDTFAYSIVAVSSCIGIPAPL